MLHRTPRLALALLALAAACAGADSLWLAAGHDGVSWFSDVKARRVGDVVTVLIDEESEATTDLKQSESKVTDTTGTIEELRNLLLISLPKEGEALGTGLPKVSWNSNRKYDATAKSESKDKMALHVSAVVKEVLPNGNLLIEGYRQIRHDHDQRLVHVAGIVRPTDVAADNTVRSEAIAEARISYEGEGPSARMKSRGWASRLLDSIWPF